MLKNSCFWRYVCKTIVTSNLSRRKVAFTVWELHTSSWWLKCYYSQRTDRENVAQKTFEKISRSSKILCARLQVSEVGLISHDTFNSNRIYFVLITWLIKYRKELTNIIAKSQRKQDNFQRLIFQISNLSVPNRF